MKSRLSASGVKSFIAHVVGVAAGVVVGAAAVAAFAVIAPTAFAWTAIGVMGLGGAFLGGKAADLWFHMARGESLDSNNKVQEIRAHFTPAATPTLS